MFIPFLCVGSVFAGVLGYTWYESLTAEEKKQADRQAGELAQTLFANSLESLTKHQVKLVYDQVKKNFGY